MEKRMPNVVKAAIEQALLKLRATGCAYKVMLPDDVVLEHELERLEPTKIKRVRNFASGELKAHYWHYVENMRVGEVVEIPCTDRISGEVLQSTVSAALGHAWGKGSYTTSVNHDTNKLEVLRLK